MVTAMVFSVGHGGWTRGPMLEVPSSSQLSAARLFTQVEIDLFSSSEASTPKTTETIRNCKIGKYGRHVPIQAILFHVGWYCWWPKSCTSYYYWQWFYTSQVFSQISEPSSVSQLAKDTVFHMWSFAVSIFPPSHSHIFAAHLVETISPGRITDWRVVLKITVWHGKCQELRVIPSLK